MIAFCFLELQSFSQFVWGYEDVLELPPEYELLELIVKGQ
jgi:hypothetical protein